MPHLIGFVDDSNGQSAHYNLLQVIRDFAAANGWQVNRYDTAPDNRELLLQAPGYTGADAVYCGIRTYQSVTADYYNLAVMCAAGFVAGNTFDTQPGAVLSGVPAHNQRIDYWLTLNPQRIAGGIKVGTPVYESFYLGKFFPYARPSQYPYPVVCGGMLNGTPAIRFSDTAHFMPWKGSRANLQMRFVDGLWKQPAAYPWNNVNLAGDTAQLRDTGGVYPITPVEMMDANGVYGFLDGVFHIPGFNNAVENTFTLDGADYVVLQDVYRTGFKDYFALRLD